MIFLKHQRFGIMKNKAVSPTDQMLSFPIFEIIMESDAYAEQTLFIF